MTPILEPVLKPAPAAVRFSPILSPHPQGSQGSVIHVFLEGCEFYWVGRQEESY